MISKPIAYVLTISIHIICNLFLLMNKVLFSAHQKYYTNNKQYSPHVEYAQQLLPIVYCLYIFIYYTYNTKGKLTLWPPPISHKQAHIPIIQKNTHPHTHIKAYTTFITKPLIPTNQLRKLKTFIFIITIWLSLTPIIHQAPSLHSQHIHPPTNQTHYSQYSQYAQSNSIYSMYDTNLDPLLPPMHTKVTLTYRSRHPTNNQRYLQNQCSENNPYFNFKHHHKLTYLPNPHSTHQPHPKNTTASAYRPRHTNNNAYHFINNWKSNSITSQNSTNNTKSHFSLQQVETTIPALPNFFTTTKFTIIIYLKTNMKNPKTLHSHGYYFINKLELLKCGDIELNPGPMPNILHTHPAIHKKRANIYFIPNTIKLQPEYQHIANTFDPILKTTHPLQPQAITTYPHLHQYIQTQRQSPPTHILYALIITIHPSIDTCNNILAQPQNYHFNNIWTNTLIIRLANLPNPPERHILTPHPYTTFMAKNQDIILPKNSIHTELYEFIHIQDTTPTPTTLKNKFPFLPNQLITEALRYLENINEYSHPPPPPAIPALTTRINTDTAHETNIITWNASSLNTSLPNLQSLINNSLNNASIIHIQETKLTANKSPKYIQNIFLEFKLIFNNTHALTRCIQQRLPYTPGRGGLLTLIHKKYAFPGNISKIPSPINISPYLQIIKINNHPLLPWLIIHMYMPTHLEDTCLIPHLKNEITNQITIHPNHIYILCGDFNRDIALRGRQNNNINTPPQEQDY